jgi:hypothetical protein
MEQNQSQVEPEQISQSQTTSDENFFGRSFSRAYEGVESPQEAVVEPDQPAVVEPVKPAESNHDPDMYEKLERIARAERSAIEREMRAKQEMQEAQRLKEKYSKFENAYSLKDQDPMAAIEELGIDFEDIQNRYKDDRMPTSRREAELMKKVQDMEARQNEFFENQKKAQEEQQKKLRQQQEQEQVGQLMNTFKKIATDTKDADGSLKYELIEGENAYNMVFDYMEQEYKKTGKVMPLESAMDAVEKNLEDIMQRVVKYKKFGRFGQERKTDQPHDSFISQAQKQTQSTQSTTPTTINSNFVASQPPPSNRPLSRSESLRRAAELLQFDD